jgi:hypothetical protein
MNQTWSEYKRLALALVGLILMAALLAVSVLPADAHQGAADNTCRQTKTLDEFGLPIIACTDEPEVGQIVLFLEPQVGALHRQVVVKFPAAEGPRVGFDCGHQMDGDQIPFCIQNNYEYYVVGN